MSLPVNLQMGLSSDGFGIRTPEVQENLYSNPLIPVNLGFGQSSSSFFESINQRIESKEKKNKLTQYRFPLDLPKYNFTIIQHTPYEMLDISFLTTLGKKNLGAPTAVYRLPLPTRLADSHNTNFADLSPLNMAANLAKKTLNAHKERRDQKIEEAIKRTNWSEGLKSQKREMMQQEYDKSFAGMANRAINKADNASFFLDTFGALTGTKIANAKVVAITSPEFRTFSLSWHFVPKSFKESLEIQKICYNLRKNMTPELMNTLAFAAKFPSIYTMFFQPNVKFLYKFKPCVLTSISVNYASGGVPAFYKEQNSNPQFSPPESVVLNTTWLELDYFVQQHYEHDHNNTEDLPSSDPYGLLKDSFTITGGWSTAPDTSNQGGAAFDENNFPR
jgi:hypothetical protein